MHKVSESRARLAITDFPSEERRLLACKSRQPAELDGARSQIAYQRILPGGCWQLEAGRLRSPEPRKSAIARRNGQHARRVRYPDYSVRSASIGLTSVAR